MTIFGGASGLRYIEKKTKNQWRLILNPYEQLVRAAYVFGQNPSVSGITELLLPLISVINDAKNREAEELVDTIAAGIDNLIGTEENALITGPDDPDSQLKLISH